MRRRSTRHGAPRRRSTPAIVAILLFAAALAVHAASLPPSVARALVHARIPESAISLYVRDVEAGRTVLEYGADRALDPASTIKLVTTYAALDRLGPAYTWKTEVYATGPVRDGVLAGDLVLKGYGDPKLTVENFWLLLRNVRARGIRDIRGDLVLDRSYFAHADYDAARFDGEPTRPYNTPPDALLVNFKAVTLQFMPDAEANQVRLQSEPALPAVQIVNALKLVHGPCGDWLGKMKADAQSNGTAARIAFSGSYALDCGDRVRSYSVLDNAAYIGSLFAALWQELGGTFSGSVRNGTVDANARLVTTGRSPALSEVVRDINKYSNNVMARQLFLTLGAEALGAPATPEKSREAVQAWLAQRGIAAAGIVLENGSGLSRIERISARTMAMLLLDAYRSPVMSELMASMPLVAVDGTMKKRLGNAGIAGHAHVKTGTLEGARAIAGYVLDARGRRDVVVFMVNHPNAYAAQAAQDALLEWVYERGPH